MCAVCGVNCVNWGDPSYMPLMSQSSDDHHAMGLPNSHHSVGSVRSQSHSYHQSQPRSLHLARLQLGPKSFSRTESAQNRHNKCLIHLSVLNILQTIRLSSAKLI